MIYEMPPAIKGRQRTIPALNHRFERDMTCKCGTAWADHQACALPCTKCHPLPDYITGSLASMCRAHYVTNIQIGEAAGCSKETVRRVWRNYIEVDFDTRATVLRIAHEVLEQRQELLR